MTNDFLVFGAPLIEEAEVGEVVDSLRSGWLGTGPKVARFEEDFRTYKGASHAVAVSSCTAFGKNSSAMARCTSNVSSALHTPGR